MTCTSYILYGKKGLLCFLYFILFFIFFFKFNFFKIDVYPLLYTMISLSLSLSLCLSLIALSLSLFRMLCRYSLVWRLGFERTSSCFVWCLLPRSKWITLREEVLKAARFGLVWFGLLCVYLECALPFGGIRSCFEFCAVVRGA